MNTKIMSLAVIAICLSIALVAEYRGMPAATASEPQLLAAKDDRGNQGGGTGGQGNQGGGTGGQGNQGGGTGGQGNQGGVNGGQGGGNSGNQGAGDGGQGDRGGGKTVVQGRGLRQHAAALDHVLTRYGLHTQPARTYEYKHPNIHPLRFASQSEKEAWNENLHLVTCSMFRYLQRLRELRPDMRVDYVEWVVDRVAEALNEDPAEVKAALLGYPHQHGHTSPLLRGISEEGCARGAALPVEVREQLGEEHELKGGDATSSRFTIDDQSTDQEIAFRITESGGTFTDFGVSHEKELHLIIIRDDLRHFAHLHPERDADGTWKVPHIPPTGGTYWFFADFVDEEIEHHTVRFARTYDGDSGKYGFVPSPRRRKYVNPYTVILEETPYSDGTILTFHIDDDQRKAPFIEPYLGRMGHGIMISQDGDFIHTHPSPVGDHITLHIPKHLEKTYRLFIQFQVKQKLYTAEFDLIPPDDAR